MEVPRHWRLKKQRYTLTGEICPNCKAPLFPPRAVCPYCVGRDAQRKYALQEQPVLALQEQAHPVEK